MQRLYLVPVETVISGEMDYNGPKYFHWKYDPDPPGIPGPTACMRYGFHPYYLLLAHDIAQADHDALILNADVYAFPPLDQLDNKIGPQDNLDEFFEGIDLPTDWLTPANTYREFIRELIYIFLFHQRYWGISQGADLFASLTLEDTYSDLTAQEQAWFDATVESYGWDSGLILPNMKFRQLLKQASDWMAGRTVYIGGVEF